MPLPDETVRALLEARIHDPFSVLGMHREHDGLWLRAWVPGASAVSVAAQLLPRAFGQSWLSAVYAAAYPIGSGVLLVTVLTALVALRFQVDASWVLTAGACGSLFAGQVVFAQRAADGTFAFGTWLDAVYLAGPVLMALAAWTRVHGSYEARTNASSTTMLLTALATLLAVAVLAMGLYPKPFTDVMHVSVDNLLKHVAVSKIPSL